MKFLFEHSTWRFSEESPKIVHGPHKSFRTFSENSEDHQRFPKISVDYRRLPMKIRRRFDHTPTNLRHRNYHNFVRVRFLRTFLRAENVSTAWEEVIFSSWDHDDLTSAHVVETSVTTIALSSCIVTQTTVKYEPLILLDRSQLLWWVKFERRKN